jgi:hypothetical protein
MTGEEQSSSESEGQQRADADPTPDADRDTTIDFPADPVTRHGSHSISGDGAGVGTTAFLPDDTNWETEKYTDTIQKLPSDHPAKVRASVVNYLSCLEIRGQPPEADERLDEWTAEDWRKKAFLIIEAVAFREELLHGERQQFGLTRNVYLLKALARETLFTLLTSERDELDHGELQAAARRILKLRTAAMRLITAKSQFIEAVDKHLMNAVLEEGAGESDRYLREVATEYVDQFSDATVDDIVSFLRCAIRYDQQRIENTGGEYVDTAVIRILERVTDEYGREVSEAAADVALDVPYTDPVLAEVVDTVPYVDDELAETVDGTDTKRFDADEIRQRFETVTDALERVAIPDDADRDDIRSRLRTELDETDGRLQTVSLPLLDVPRAETEGAVGSDAGYEVMQDAPTAVSRLLSGGFGYVGDFGGIIYRDETNDRHLLINPWAFDHSVSLAIDNGRTAASTYAELWYRSYFADAVVEYLIYLVIRWEADPTVLPDTAIETDKIPRIPCPFCELIDGEYCGHDRCRSATLVDRINALRGDLVAAFRSAGQDLFHDDYWGTADFDRFEASEADLAEGRWHPFN